jgi:hypothetical protein
MESQYNLSFLNQKSAKRTETRAADDNFGPLSGIMQEVQTKF